MKTNQVWLPELENEFQSKGFPISDIEFQSLPQDTTFGRRLYYTEDGFQCLASVVLMGTDRSSIHKPQICLSGQGHAIETTEVKTVKIDRPHPYDLRVMKLTTSKPSTSGRNINGIYVYWFVCDGQLTPYHGERMLWMARDLITQGILQRWAYVSFLALCLPGDEEKTYERVTKLIQQAVPEFQLTTGPVLSKNVINP